MKKLYHITPAKNVKSIMLHGLIPAKSRGIGSVKSKSGVFLTNDVARIKRDQTGDWWWEKYKAVVLEINATDLIINPYVYTWWEEPKESDYEFVCDYVPPELINAPLV